MAITTDSEDPRIAAFHRAGHRRKVMTYGIAAAITLLLALAATIVVVALLSDAEVMRSAQRPSGTSNATYAIYVLGLWALGGKLARDAWRAHKQTTPS